MQNTYNEKRGSQEISLLLDIQKKKQDFKSREKQKITYKCKPLRIRADFLTRILKARRAWGEIFQALTANNFQPRLTYPPRFSFKIDGEIRTLLKKNQLDRFVNIKSPFHKILQEHCNPDEMNILRKVNRFKKMDKQRGPQ